MKLFSLSQALNQSYENKNSHYSVNILNRYWILYFGQLEHWSIYTKQFNKYRNIWLKVFIFSLKATINVVWIKTTESKVLIKDWAWHHL